MLINITTTPRKFTVGNDNRIVISDFGKIKLEPNEMITFKSTDDLEYDVVSKEWGFYATPSMNDRLLREGFKSALVKNLNNQHYIMLVDKNKLKTFEEYLISEKQEIVNWLDEIVVFK
jgi:hypothetical protein